eukprot:6491705-Amphidinium_carterae.1
MPFPRAVASGGAVAAGAAAADGSGGAIAAGAAAIEDATADVPAGVVHRDQLGQKCLVHQLKTRVLTTPGFRRLQTESVPGRPPSVSQSDITCGMSATSS